MVIFFIFNSYYLISQSVITYIIKPGDNLSKISKEYNVSVDNLIEFNGLYSDVIYIGKTLLIPIVVDITPLNNFTIRNKIKETYYSQIGIREKTGNNDGYDVEKYLNSAGLGKGYPWCASFIYWVYLKNNLKISVKYPAWVPSYFPPNKLIYVRGKFENKKPKPGDLIGIWFRSKNRLAHIGFYDDEDDKFFITVEGNTNNAGSREGDGVYRKRRIKRQVHSISSWIDD
jgi:LysM repeat protein